ncbi:hypothetical protein DAPPUDRAFT_311860 [Daphnia pulex]|uniref:Uncharacterized protein n=1 Tax=Daphnia pulex TaxID=6669 RepID=E9FY53_DAPPU|nr:hypothetical protein DAPPUDRAFT_311860 [Daphnia pulex]|eukprot:EFX87478.1 hypothetical protein DAPPUDRAFT_311860 [Daphnia pulex]
MSQSILQICKLSSKTIQNQGISICKTHSNPSNVNLQKERHVKLVMQWCRGWTHPQERQPAKGKARKTCQKKRPIPRNFNLQKERAVRLSFTFEGHGDHYMKRAMQLGVEVG